MLIVLFQFWLLAYFNISEFSIKGAQNSRRPHLDVFEIVQNRRCNDLSPSQVAHSVNVGGDLLLRARTYNFQVNAMSSGKEAIRFHWCVFHKNAKERLPHKVSFFPFSKEVSGNVDQIKVG